MKSQCDAILAYMKLGNAITPLEALRICGCFRLAARIYDLRERGYEVECELVELDGSRVASYYLA